MNKLFPEEGVSITGLLGAGLPGKSYWMRGLNLFFDKSWIARGSRLKPAITAKLILSPCICVIMSLTNPNAPNPKKHSAAPLTVLRDPCRMCS